MVLNMILAKSKGWAKRSLLPGCPSHHGAEAEQRPKLFGTSRTQQQLPRCNKEMEVKYVLFQPGQGRGQRALKYSKKCSKEVPSFTVPSLTTTTPEHGTGGVVPFLWPKKEPPRRNVGSSSP